MKARFLLAVLLSLGATVSTSPFCLGAEHAQMIAMSQGNPPMPPPGNPDHKEPKPGAFCDRSKTPARHCECHKKCVQDPNKPDDPNALIVEEDAHCRAWCYKSHCLCPHDCE